MKTNTGNKIFDFIQQKGEVSPKEIISFVGLGAPAIFRQLQKMLSKGLIQKTGKPPRVFYHVIGDKKQQIITRAFNWVQSPKPDASATEDTYCAMRDVFEARNRRVIQLLQDNREDESFSYLLTAIIGELGNNSFDHNVANWPDITGVYFIIDCTERIAIIADRGRGVKATLINIRPEIKDDKGALRIAFREIISGRSPEQRGNGLKFVRNKIIDLDLHLEFYSGDALYSLSAKKETCMQVPDYVRGTLAIIKF
ncbi:winged helix-turn-helix domain-containing protein [Patescibacteria group bacterium]|nr:winged helix-turn-helix domain-containing protein [Patescibacteria group bacterium]